MTLKGLENCRDDFGDLSGNAVYYANDNAIVCAECVTTRHISVISGKMLAEHTKANCSVCWYLIKGAVKQYLAPKKAKQARNLETIDQTATNPGEYIGVSIGLIGNSKKRKRKMKIKTLQTATKRFPVLTLYQFETLVNAGPSPHAVLLRSIRLDIYFTLEDSCDFVNIVWEK